MMNIVLIVILLNFFLSSPNTIIIASAQVSSCARCTMQTASLWCPDDMSCQSINNCKCSNSKCLSLSQCFLQEETCVGCINSGGVFCMQATHNNNNNNNNNNKQGQCFLPSFNTIPLKGLIEGTESQQKQKQQLENEKLLKQECHKACLPGGNCLSQLHECPAEKLDHVIIAWLTTNAALAAIVTAFIVLIVYRGLHSIGRYEREEEDQQQQQQQQDECGAPVVR